MARLVENRFTEYELTAQEMLVAQTLTPEQKMYYQTLLAAYAERRLAIKFDGNNPIAFAQEEADYKGRIEILTQLLEDSEDAIQRQAELDQQQSQS